MDHDGSNEQLTELFDHVKIITQSAAIFDAMGDRDLIQADTFRVLRGSMSAV